MVVQFFRPKNLSRKLLRIIFSIYLSVTFLVTCAHFITEYLKTQENILEELKQLEKTVHKSVSTSLWQYNQKQLDALSAGLLQLPFVVGIDISEGDNVSLISKRTYSEKAEPFFVFYTHDDLKWELKDKEISLGEIRLYSSSAVVFDRVIFGFTLTAITAVIKVTIFLSLFLWAFDRFLAFPLRQLMFQVDTIKLEDKEHKRINLALEEENELSHLQDHINRMLDTIEQDREKLIENEKAKRLWLEEEVSRRTQELVEANEKLKELAAHDSLTGALNRRSFFENAQHLLNLALRRQAPSCILLMDLDFFKDINDKYGHFAGDKVLSHFVGLVSRDLRKSDLMGRIGGEEFVVFLPDTDMEGAANLAQKICKMAEKTPLEVDGELINYTVSIGVACSQGNDEPVEELYKRADAKMYQAKEKGRNRVEK